MAVLLRTLTQIQIEFVATRLGTKSDKKAAEIIGISPTTAYSWPNKGDVDKAIQLATLGSLDVAREKLSRLVLQAVNVLEKEMEKGQRLAAAREVMDRTGLVAIKGLDVTSGGEKLSGGLTDEQRIENLAALFEYARKRTLG